MPSPGYTSPKTQKGLDARQRAFNRYWKQRVHPQVGKGGSLTRRGVFVPRDPSRHPGRGVRGQRA